MSKLKSSIFDWIFIATTCWAYYSIPRGLGQRKLVELYQITHNWPDDSIVPYKDYLFSLQHSLIAPYAAISILTLLYVYSKPTSKSVRIIIIGLAVIAVPLNFIAQRLT